MQIEHFVRMNLQTNLPLLEANQLIRRIEDEDWAYLFKHTLLQETVHKSLLRTDCKRLHFATAQAIERAYPDRVDENAALLARHYAEAGDDVKTFEFSLRAGERALRVNAYPEALMQFDCARQVQALVPFSPEELIRLYTQRGRTFEHIGQQDIAVENYQELQRIGELRHEPRLELAALLAIASLYATPTTEIDLPSAEALCKHALTLARQLDDRDAQARVLWNLMLREYFGGEPHKAIEYGEQALALARADGLRERLAYALNDISRIYVGVGRMAEGIAAREEAQALWQALGNLPMLADNLSTSAEMLSEAGDLDRALQLAGEADHLSEQINNLWNRAYSGMTVAQILAERGELERALALYANVGQWATQSGFMIGNLVAETGIALALGELGAVTQAIGKLHGPLSEKEDTARVIAAWISAARARLELIRGDSAQAHFHLAIARERLVSDDLSNLGPLIVALLEAELALAEGRPVDAAAICAEWVARIRRAGLAVYLADFLFVQSKALVAQGDPDAAGRALDDALQTSEAMNARRLLWQIYAAKAELEKMRGDMTHAAEWWERARGVLDFIIAHTPPELREGFLNTPAVRRIVETSRDRKTLAVA